MVMLAWVRGLLARRRARMLATIVGVAVAVSLIAAIGAFLSGSSASMTERALARVPLDWQVQAAPGTSPDALLRSVAAFAPVHAALPVSFAETRGFTATAGGVTRTASAGLVLGVPASYRSTFPGELRQFIGATDGVLIAQQMAANLGVGVGDTISIERAGLPAASIRIDGVIDFAAPAELLSPVATAAGGALVPPPDNVLVVPDTRWHALFDGLARSHPSLIRQQVHAELVHASLPHDPSAAFAASTGLARNLEARLAGTGIVGDNLAAALDKARGDSLYARIAFLFLGLPGALLAALLTVAIATSGAERRRRDQALLRARGATMASLVRIALAETVLVGVAGGLLGLASAAVIGRIAFGSAGFGAGPSSAAAWSAAALLAGIVLAAAAITLPAIRDARNLTVAGARATIGRPRAPWFARFGVDAMALAAALLAFRATGGNGYQLVLAVEGSPQVSVDYWSFAAPLFAWIGIGLATYRIADLVLRRGQGLLRRVARPVSANLAGTVAASMGRQRRPIARALTLVCLTTCFAATTAAFNTTYQQQAEADARLTNGADVVVTASDARGISRQTSQAIAHAHGVRSTAPLQHRYAYIGKDLQDLYGVDARTIARTAQLQDSWFAGGSAAGLFTKLARTPNGVLLSEEVVRDYQLRVGDRITLRVLEQGTRRPIAIPFTYIGITKEFPTAPKDAYTIVNASYIARATGDPGIATLLVQTTGSTPAAVGARLRGIVGSTTAVTDIESNRKLVASSLTSVELRGLTRVELAYALVLVAAATGLLLWLGLAERRRTFAIAHALGARPRQLGGFVWTEMGFVTLGGVALGAAGAAWLTWMLVKLLTGVFDPPPASPAVPWGYLGELALIALVAVVAAGLLTLRTLRRPALETLRDA